MPGYLSYHELYSLIRKELSSDFEARQLFSFITGFRRAETCPHDVVIPPETLRRAAALTARRKSGEPLQYIIGEWEFYGIPLYVGEGVLIPRADTETLVDIALEIAGKQTHPLEILDLCSGSGCIPIAIAKNLPNAALTAVELSDAAYQYLTKNICHNSVNVTAVKTDITTYTHPAKADIITANPPYIPTDDIKDLQTEVSHEPHTALCGGSDGLDFYRMIASRYHSRLKTGGHICLEVGFSQHIPVKNILEAAGFQNIRIHKDLCGIERVITAEVTK